MSHTIKIYTRLHTYMTIPILFLISFLMIRAIYSVMTKSGLAGNFYIYYNLTQFAFIGMASIASVVGLAMLFYTARSLYKRDILLMKYAFIGFVLFLLLLVVFWLCLPPFTPKG